MLALALALAGLGFGITVVPLTSAVLTHIPARHSGVAASATNTARQLGAVVGVAVLGAIVNAHLVDGVNKFAAENPLTALNATFKQDVIKVLETGGDPGTFSLDNIPDPFVRAFLDGLQLSLVVATVLIVLAGLVSALVKEPRPLDDEAELS
jgi:hypothetical protein